MTRAWTCCDGNTGKKTGRGEPSIYLFHTLGLFPVPISFILFHKYRSWLFFCLFFFGFYNHEATLLNFKVILTRIYGQWSVCFGIGKQWCWNVERRSWNHTETKTNAQSFILIFCVETKRFNINDCLNKSRNNVEWVSLGVVLYFDWPNQRSLDAMENLYRSVYKWEIFNSLFRKLRTLNLRTGIELNDLNEEFHKLLDRGKNQLQ